MAVASWNKQYLLLILRESAQRVRKMENKTHEEASTIKVSSLTCLDLANSDLHQSAVLLKQACIDCGFFYVINHGISEALKDEVFEQSKKFFALPLENKIKVLRNETHRGYSPALEQKQIHGDYNKESFFMGTEGPKDDLHGDNHSINPTFGLTLLFCPDGGRPWRNITKKHYYFDTSEMLGNPIAYMRLLHYEGMSDPSRGIYGCGAHTDHGMMTLLATDSVMGLQICKDKDVKPQKWEYVPSIKGAYIANLGDVMERWSNGLFKSTLHRVLGNGHDRYSIPFFVSPSHDCLVECLPTCQTENNLPKYQAIKCSTYLTQRYKESHVGLSTK